MANQESKLVGGKSDPIRLVEVLNQTEQGDALSTRGIPGRGRMVAYPVQFSAGTGGVRKLFAQHIPLDDQQESGTTSCPSEVFLG